MKRLYGKSYRVYKKAIRTDTVSKVAGQNLQASKAARSIHKNQVFLHTSEQLPEVKLFKNLINKDIKTYKVLSNKSDERFFQICIFLNPHKSLWKEIKEVLSKWGEIQCVHRSEDSVSNCPQIDAVPVQDPCSPFWKNWHTTNTYVKMPRPKMAKPLCKGRIELNVILELQKQIKTMW